MTHPILDRAAWVQAWRLARFFCVALFLLHVWREALDELVFTDDYHLRSAILSYSMIAGYLSAGLWAGWRTGAIVPGGMAAILSCWSGWAGGLLVAAVLGVSGIDQFHPGGVDELFFLPFMTLPIAVALGLVGASIGGVVHHLTTPTMS